MANLRTHLATLEAEWLLVEGEPIDQMSTADQAEYWRRMENTAKQMRPIYASKQSSEAQAENVTENNDAIIRQVTDGAGGEL